MPSNGKRRTSAMNKLESNVLSALSRAETFLSGEMLAMENNVSRAAVWKAVRSLKEKGYPIESEKKRGYFLHPTEKLYAEGICLSFPCDVFVFESLDSTSSEAKRRLRKKPILILAEMQTQGKGRRNSVFPSPPSGTYFTLGVPLRFPLTRFPAYKEMLLSLIAEHFSCEREEHSLVKEGNKVGGVLLESEVEYDECTALFIGVGYYPPLANKLSSLSALCENLYAALKK